MDVNSNRWLKRGVALSLVGVLALLLGVEVALRVALGLGNPPLMVPHPRIGYLFKANQAVKRFGNDIVYNQFHQRSDPTTPGAQRGVQRLMVIGDSVVGGGALTDQTQTIGEQLEFLLSRGGTCEVLAPSAGSWGIGNEAAYLREFGTFGCSVVIWQIGSHDLLQAKSSGEVLGQDPRMPVRKPLCAWTELLARYGLPRFRKLLARGHEAGWRGPETTGTSACQDFRSNLDFFRAGVRLCRSQGAAVVVLLTPDRVELLRGARSPETRREFKSEAAGAGVPVLDLLEHWNAAHASLFRDGVHLNEHGNAVLARFIASQLTSGGTFPPSPVPCGIDAAK
jgi:hypothetical protein